MKGRGYVNIVVFDPNEMSDFKRNSAIFMRHQLSALMELLLKGNSDMSLKNVKNLYVIGAAMFILGLASRMIESHASANAPVNLERIELLLQQILASCLKALTVNEGKAMPLNLLRASKSQEVDWLWDCRLRPKSRKIILW